MLRNFPAEAGNNLFISIAGLKHGESPIIFRKPLRNDSNPTEETAFLLLKF
jgi:hypothetical protein